MPTQSGIWNLKQVRDGVAGASYAQQPLIDGITGDIGGVQTTLTISGVAFGLLQGTVRFTSGATTADVTVTPASDVSMTVNVPQAIYELATGSTVGIKFIPVLGVQSNTFNKTVTKFSIDFLVLAGGGPGGLGGGGAGGYRCSVTGENSGGGASAESKLAFETATNYTVTVGGGGAASNPINGSNVRGANGSISVFSTITSIGGGAGAQGLTNDTSRNEGVTGGSGGGGGGDSTGNGYEGPGGSGTANQGFAGGKGRHFGGAYVAGGGGGGAGGVGTNYVSGGQGGNGGNGIESSITGSTVPRGGGGAGHGNIAPYNGTAGSGGGGNAGPMSYSPAESGSENTGGGGGGAWYGDGNAGSGGSGVVIIKYSDALTLSNPGGGLTSTTATAGGFKVTTFTAGTGNVSFA
jgi:hypothetical protein